MKDDNGRTYDFCQAQRRPRRRGSERRVAELLVDGWSAYYRWLAELKNRLTEGDPRQSAE